MNINKIIKVLETAELGLKSMPVTGTVINKNNATIHSNALNVVTKTRNQLLATLAYVDPMLVHESTIVEVKATENLEWPLSAWIKAVKNGLTIAGYCEWARAQLQAK